MSESAMAAAKRARRAQRCAAPLPNGAPSSPRSKRLAEIDAALADPLLYDRDPAKVATLSKARADAARCLSEAEHQWLSLSEAYESAIAAR